MARPVGPWSKMEKYLFLLVTYSIIIATRNGAASLAEKMDGENKLIGFPSPLLLQMCTNLVERGGIRLASDAHLPKEQVSWRS